MSGIKKKKKSFWCYKYNTPQYTKRKVQSSQQIKERKKKSRNTEREGKLGPVHAEGEREIGRDRGSSLTRRLAQCSAREGRSGQREINGWAVWVSDLRFLKSHSRVYHKINSKDLSICQNLEFLFLFLFFFPTIGVLVLRWCRVGEAKKKKNYTAWTPMSGESCQYPCLTHVGHRHVAKNGVSVQPLYLIFT